MREDIAEEIAERTPQGIAAALARLVNDGRLAPGERLPTVRDVATALSVSPATVSAAWQALSRAGILISRGRAGSFVRETRPEWLSRRIHGMAGHGAPLRLDLSPGTPDPAFLPPLADAFSRVSSRAEYGSYQDDPVLPALRRHMLEVWPTEPESLTVTDGALDGVGRTLQEVVRFGDRVAIESPGFPHFFDLLEVMGAEAVPLALDSEGVRPDSLAQALVRRVSAVVLQPRAQNPTGASMSESRARELAAVIRASRDGDRVLVIEDDHSGLISTSPDVTLSMWLPDQVVHVRSFSKSHGPDLRIAALGGPARIVDRVVARRILGPGWTSRILQTVLLDLLTDSESTAIVGRAREAYRSRQAEVAEGLARRGIQIPRSDGINLWLPVPSEAAAIVRLAAAGIGVAAGSSFTIGHERRDAVRVTAGLIPDGAEGISDALADAADPRGGLPTGR